MKQKPNDANDPGRSRPVMSWEEGFTMPSEPPTIAAPDAGRSSASEQMRWWIPAVALGLGAILTGAYFMLVDDGPDAVEDRAAVSTPISRPSESTTRADGSVEMYRSLPPSPSASAELHVIGSFRPADPPTEGERALDETAIHVEVRALENPLVLVLTAYEQTDWVLSVDPDADVDYIIVSGSEAQRVFMEGSRAPIYSSTDEHPGSFPPFYAFEDDSALRYALAYDDEQRAWLCTDEPDPHLNRDRQMPALLEQVKAMTGLTPRGMQGQYTGSAFEVSEFTRDAQFLAPTDGGYCYEGMAGLEPR